jgi:hypothetical protein
MGPDEATPLLRQAHAYWDGRRRGRRMPARADIDPLDILPLLPHVILMDVLRDAKPGWPLDFRYRLLGTRVDAMMNARYTGLCLSDLPHQRPPGRLWDSLATVTAAQEPRINRVPYVGPHKDYLSVVDMVMPLSADGAQVDMLFCIVDFVPR